VQTTLIRDAELDPTLVEEILIFAVNGFGMSTAPHGAHQYCISIEQPNLTLAGVLLGMLRNEDCQTDIIMRRRYSDKIFSVLRIMAKALKHLHASGIVHGNVCLENCGKFKSSWKLTSLLGSQRTAATFNPIRHLHAAPPESIVVLEDHSFGFRDNLVAHPSQDVWAFGKMAYDVLVGDPLIPFDQDGRDGSKLALAAIYRWDEANVDSARQHLARVGVSDDGIDLISHCLAAEPDIRPPMEALLQHPCWKALRQQRR
jgi:serine/threonine protein kinase